MFARMIDQDSPHQPRGNGKKVNSILPVYRIATNQPQISLVDKGSALQSVVARVFGNALPGDPPQLFIDQRDQSLARRSLSLVPASQQNRDLIG